MYPTVADVLDLDVVRQGKPLVITGSHSALHTRVRWVHVSELADIAHLLSGGELVLTTGIALPGEPAGLRRYVDELADVGVAGLVVELGRRYVQELPTTLAAAARRRDLPLIALHREIRFVCVTEAVHALIVNAQLAELEASERIHETFTELSIEGASTSEVVRQVASMAGLPVVLENLAHQVVAYEVSGRSAGAVLDGWERQSRSVTPGERTAWVADAGWLVTVVGARGEDWGRLVLFCDREPPVRFTVLLERAAGALALRRLVERDHELLERQSHRSLLAAIMTHSQPDGEVGLRSRALGVPLEGRRLGGLVILPRPYDRDIGVGTTGGEARDAHTETQARLRAASEIAAQVAREMDVPALTGGLDERSIGVLLSVEPDHDTDEMVEDFAAAFRRVADQRGLVRVVVAAGNTVSRLRDARRSLVEAKQVANAAQLQDSSRVVFRLPDVGLPGFLYLLRDDPRLQTYVERELGVLLAHDATHGGRLVDVLRTYLEFGRNKSAAASAAHMSRPAFYDRLARIERMMGTRLDSVEACLSLHVALLGLDVLRSRRR